MEPGYGRVEDLATLSTLDEKIILDELRLRYQREIIYTYIADILIAVNPYKPVALYSTEIASQYVKLPSLRHLPPHLFAVSDACYQHILQHGANQCCIVSGESGAGKTESSKLMIQHIAKLCGHHLGNLHERIIQVNPLLEAFGNARTVMNNNSSRFGKYVELQFDRDGRLLGAQIQEYLLEKSRVVSQGAGEKNFHIFYYMFAGLDAVQLRNNLLEQADMHRILRPVDGSRVFQSEADFFFHREMWGKLTHIMSVVGFQQEEMNAILASVAAILFITDIAFAPDTDTDGVYIKDEAMLEMAAQLLGVIPEELAAAFISNVNFVRGERIVMLKRMEEANEGRDALAKALYSRLFGWIVRQVNYMLKPAVADRSILGPRIGILDIAGFENFPVNSFEQLCINTANEQLQFYFNQHVFQWEMDEYKKEGIKTKDVKFIDNRSVLDVMLESHTGLLALMDEESRFPQASDTTLTEKLHKNLNKKVPYVRPKGPALTFTIQHYAGPVVYEVTGFLEKNRDTLSWNLLECMKNSDSQFVCDLFFAPISDTGSLMRNDNLPKRSRNSLLLCKAPDLSYTKGRSLSKQAGKRLRRDMQATPGQRSNGLYENMVKTVSSHFKNSLTDLMEKLMTAEPHFVRCIRPNPDKRSDFFQPDCVNNQLRYTGVLETVKIRRQGFAVRLPFETFLARYKIIAFPLTGKVPVTDKSCSKIMKRIGLKDWETGKSKVFLKYWHTEELQAVLITISKKVVCTQKVVRRFLAKKRLVKIRQQGQLKLQEFRALSQGIADACEHYFFLQTRLIDEDACSFNNQAYQRQAQMNQARSQLQPVVNSAAPAVSDPQKKKKLALFQPTPIILGNPVTGDPNPVTLNPNDAIPTSGYRHSDTTTQRHSDTDTGPRSAPVWTSASRSSYEDEAYQGGRFIRNCGPRLLSPKSSGSLSPLALAAKPTEMLMRSLLDEVLERLPVLDVDIWAKVLYMEKQEVVAKVYIREWEIIIDDSKENFDGSVMGINAFTNPNRDANTTQVIKKIGKGLKITRDAAGNVFATRLSTSDVICKGYKNPEKSCYSEEVISKMGRLEQSKPLMVFSMKEFKSHLALGVHTPQLDGRKLQALSMINLAFVRNTFDDLETPCWLIVVNFKALDMLGDDQVLDELRFMTDLRISPADFTQLQRNWMRLKIKRQNGQTPLFNEESPNPPQEPKSFQKDDDVMSQLPPPTSRKNWAKLSALNNGK